MRASDDDRAATVRRIQDAVVRGLLAPDEGSDRMAAAWAAVHVHDLGPLTTDLPPAPTTRTGPGWRALGTMAVEQARTSLHAKDSGRLSPPRIAAAVAVALLLLLLVGSLVGELLFDGDFDGGPMHDGGFGH
jgi:hypothetical protein